MSKYYEISGYWKDNKEPFDGYIIKEYDDFDENDDIIFFYGIDEKQLQDNLGKEDSDFEFVITSYKETKL